MIVTEVLEGIEHVSLDGQEEAALHAASDRVWPLPPDAGELELFRRTRQASAELHITAPELTRYLRCLAAHRGPKATVVALPKDGLAEIGPTPTEYAPQGQPTIHKLDVWRALLVGAAEWYPFGFTSQQSGALLNDIIAIRRFTDTNGHSGSAKHELGLHNEDASYNLGEGLNISADFLTLHYFRNPTAIPTVLSWPRWEQLRPATRSLLREPWAVNMTNPAQGGPGNDAMHPVSVCFGPTSDPYYRINTARLGLDRYDDDRRNALQDFAEHLEARRVEIAPDPGDVLVIDNLRAVHGRPAYTPVQQPRFDGTDRWQRRLTVSNSAARIRAFEAREHVVDPKLLRSALTGAAAAA